VPARALRDDEVLDFLLGQAGGRHRFEDRERQPIADGCRQIGLRMYLCAQDSRTAKLAGDFGSDR
jgi:hypothetical protein